MQSKKEDPNRPKKMTVGNTFRYIYGTSGIKGLYRGVAPRIGLGVWQIKRLGWKLNLIEELEWKLKKEPISLPRNIKWVVERG